jgi:hypothetical protein
LVRYHDVAGSFTDRCIEMSGMTLTGKLYTLGRFVFVFRSVTG